MWRESLAYNEAGFVDCQYPSKWIRCKIKKFKTRPYKDDELKSRANIEATD